LGFKKNETAGNESLKKNIIYFEGQTIQAVKTRRVKGGFKVVDSASFAVERLEEYFKVSKERSYTLVVNFRRYYLETITIPPVSKRYMAKVIESEISKRSPFNDFSYIYSLQEEKIIENKKMRDVHVFAVDMKEMQSYIRRVRACGAMVRAIFPAVQAAKSLLGKEGCALGLFNAGHEMKTFIVKEGEVLFIRDVESSGKGLDDDAEARNIYLSISYCQQTLRINPERLFLIGEASTLSGRKALTLPVDQAIKPEGLDVPDDVFIKFALPLCALYAQKTSDISPPALRSEYKATMAFDYGTAAFCALTVIFLIFLSFTVKRAAASSERLLIQKDRLAHSAGVQNAYMKTLEKYERYRPFLEQGSKKPFSRLFLNLSAMDLPGVTVERLSASKSEDGFLINIEGHIEAQTLKDTEALYNGFLEYLTGPGAITIEEKGLVFEDKSFEITARLG